MELDDTLAEAHTAMGDIKFYGDWDWTAGEAEFRRAVELNPNSADASGHYATCLHLLGRSDLALAEVRRALRLDPASLRLNRLYLVMLTNMHRHEEALQQSRKIFELDPNSSGSYFLTALMYQANGQDDEALRAYLKADSLGGTDPEELKLMQSAASSGGLRGYIRQRLISLKRKAQTSRVPPISFATLYAQLGERDDAFRFLDVAFQRHSGQLAWIGAAQSWDPLRNDLRFQSLLERMHFPK
jgi:tetratricopeptide (TPR) repeat protein